MSRIGNCQKHVLIEAGDDEPSEAFYGCCGRFLAKRSAEMKTV